jgi:hypothetical protein
MVVFLHIYSGGKTHISGGLVVGELLKGFWSASTFFKTFP